MASPSRTPGPTFALSRSWPVGARKYIPQLDFGSKIRISLRSFEQELLSDETSALLLATTDESDGSVKSTVLDYDKLVEEFSSDELKGPCHRMLFVNRFLVRHRTDVLPADSNKLRLSPAALQFLIEHQDIAPAFLFALSRYYLPFGASYRPSVGLSGGRVSEFWCLLPIRISVQCTGRGRSHALSTAGNNQMNPFYYLHLPDMEVDIRGSLIALYTQYDSKDEKAFTLVVNMFDGRWNHVVEQPQKRIKECIKCDRGDALGFTKDPFKIYVIYYTTIIDWWINTLSAFGNQLIAHEKALQREQDNEDETSSKALAERNRALHSMAAHLHRYASELQSLEDTIAEIVHRHPSFTANGGEDTSSADGIGVCASLQEVLCQLKVAKGLRLELKSKIENLLALLFNRIQIMTDQMMVKNTHAMHQIMQMQQEETKLSRQMAMDSQQMTREMHDDSLAMKTIAIVTMFFLPGTSFAALLAMPFFSENAWFSDTSRFWLWIALTLPSTSLAFVFYFWLRSRDRRLRDRKQKKDDHYHHYNLGNTGEENGDGDANLMMRTRTRTTTFS